MTIETAVRRVAVIVLLAASAPCLPARAAATEAPLPAGVAPDVAERDEGVFVFDPVDAGGRAKRASLDPTELWFRTGLRLTPRPGLDPALAAGVSGPLVLQFPEPIRREWRDELLKQGLAIRDYVQNNAYLVEVPEAAAKVVSTWLDSGFLRYAGPYPVEARIEPALADWGARATSSEPRRVTVHFLHAPANEEAALLGRLLGIESVRLERRPRARGYVLTGDLARLAALPFVAWIEGHDAGRIHNFEGAMAVGADRVAGVGTYTGAGVRVATMDSGFPRSGLADQCGGATGAFHPDLGSTRLIDDWDFINDDTNACDDHGHGSHTLGTIAGDGTDTPTHKGMAPGASFLVYKDCEVTSSGGCSGFDHLDAVLTRAAVHDAQIQGNSWGGDSGVYHAGAADADDAVRGLYVGSDGLAQRMLITFSAGNDNDLVSNPGTAKNVITVGASKDGNWPNDGGACWCVHNDGDTNCGATNCDASPDVDPSCTDDYGNPAERICFSNYGKVDTDGDGFQRQKPDLVAPGTRILSVAPSYLYTDHRLYAVHDGTSMAQPMVAGAAALMYERYTSYWDWPEMMKARLLATAVPMGDRTRFGHGMLDAYHAVYDSPSLDTLRWSGRTISGTGNEVELTFTVPAGALEVRVFMTWSDPSSTTTEVVNDLDLRVYDESGALVGSSLLNDEMVEWVKVTSPAPGAWRAVVRGENVPDPPQRYGLIALARLQDAALSVNASANDTCIRPGDAVRLTATLANSGYTAVASRVILDLPNSSTSFDLVDVEIDSEDPARSRTLPENGIWEGLWRQYYVTVGQVTSVFDRTLRWNLTARPDSADAEYALYVQGEAYGELSSRVEQRIRVDGSAPATVTGLASSSHTAGTCSNDADVTMTWHTASDPGQCGVDGYGIFWKSGSPGIPGTTKDIEEVESYTETLASAATPYYFNIRAVDNAGNWSGDYVSAGPYSIDTVPPGDAWNLRSTTHPVGSCSGDPLVTILWNAAPDAHCGVDGYGILWSTNAPLMPGATKDIEEVTSWTQSIGYSELPRFFSIRTTDNATNWASTYASYGPFTVDRLPGDIRNLSVKRSGNDLKFAWDADAYANFYRLYVDKRPNMGTRSQRGGDIPGGTNSYVDPGAAIGPEKILYYVVLGTNVCGAEGP